MSDTDLRVAPEVELTVSGVSSLWDILKIEAEHQAAENPLISEHIRSAILSQDSLEHALIYVLVRKLANAESDPQNISDMFQAVFDGRPDMIENIRADLIAVRERDPACMSYVKPLLFYKGFQALQVHRIAHALWKKGQRSVAHYLQSLSSEIFNVDIHPAARIGQGIMIDHASGVVIGETAIVGDNCSILHSVTLGGSGNESGDRHPKVGNGVLIGAGATILGNIEVGDCSRIAAGSVVIKSVPKMKTVAGVPAKVVGDSGCLEPARLMTQNTLGD